MIKRKGGERMKTERIKRSKWKVNSRRVGKIAIANKITGRGKEEKQKGVFW